MRTVMNLVKNAQTAVLFAGLFQTVLAAAQPIIFEQELNNFSDWADTTIISERPENAGGGSDGIFSGTTAQGGLRRALVRIDLGSIQPGTVVVAARLELVVEESGGNAGEFDMTLHAVTRPWGEGTASHVPGGIGAAAADGDATWESNFHSLSSWDTPGGDFAPEPSSTGRPGRTGSVGVWEGPGVQADVQRWIDDPSINFGWIVISTIEGEIQRVKKFHSAEAAANRPRLTVTIAMPADINSDGVVNAVDVQLVINAALGIDIGEFNADINGGGTVNGVDVQLVINAALGIEINL